MDPVLLRLVTVVALIVVAAALGRLVATRRDRIVAVTDGGPVDLVPAAADGPTTATVSAVLFGSATCAPCAAVERLLRDVARDDPRLEWTYVDAAEHLDLARSHDVRRVPTLLVLDAHGRVVARTGGVPRHAELVDAVDRAAGGARAAEAAGGARAARAAGADVATGDVARTA